MERKNTYLLLLGDLKELVQEIQEKTKDIVNLIREFETYFISEEDRSQLDQFIQIMEQKNVSLYNNKSINQILNIRNYQFNKGRNLILKRSKKHFIKAGDDYVFGLDFDKIRNITYRGSNKTLKLWNQDKLLFEKLAYQVFVNQIQIISNQNKLISANKNCIQNMVCSQQRLSHQRKSENV